MRKVKINELKNIFARIISKLEFENIEQIEVVTDFYRIIPTDEWQTFEKDVVVVGSLYDDIEMLLLMINDADRPCMYVDFDRAASLLRAISDEMNSGH